MHWSTVLAQMSMLNCVLIPSANAACKVGLAHISKCFVILAELTCCVIRVA